MRISKISLILSTAILFIISCKEKVKTDIANQKTEYNQTLNSQDKESDSFVISCGSGCAMTYYEDSIIPGNLSNEVKFRVEMYIDEVLTEEYFETYIFRCTESKKIKQINLKGADNYKIEDQHPAIQKNLTLYANGLCRREFQEKKESANNSTSNVKDLYKKLKTISLPTEYSYDFIMELNSFISLPEKSQKIFQLEHLSNLKGVKLPSKKSIKLILISGIQEQGQSELYLFTLDNLYNISDSILLYTSQEIDEGSLSTIYKIEKKYEITVVKKETVNKTTRIVETRNFEITEEGKIVEVN
ncbi:hypothetical protein [Aquimarina algiphila]|uniref:hypothetical protein n=1 Tax=Aquimarina algiphila TaxID=2047982 RepID=UPI00232FB4AC|nr:hypothetical protein [Aquimarina algiphila]